MADTSPSLRLFELLEILCAQGHPVSLAEAVQSTGWPKPSVHRMLGQLESGGLLAREPGGRRGILIRLHARAARTRRS